MYDADKFEIVVHVVNGETELNQYKTEPELPSNINVPLVEPEQIVVPPLTEPPTEPAVTVTVVVDEFALEQLPL